MINTWKQICVLERLPLIKQETGVFFPWCFSGVVCGLCELPGGSSMGGSSSLSSLGGGGGRIPGTLKGEPMAPIFISLLVVSSLKNINITTREREREKKKYR